MRAVCDRKARKRPVNLTLNEDLVAQAREITDNLSSAAEASVVRKAVTAWNSFADKHGSFADEHSTL